MKRKAPQREERRRAQVELNISEEPKLLNVRRRGCASFFGSILLVGAALVSIGLGVR